MPHAGHFKFKALHKQNSRLSMRRNQGKPGHITRDEFSENWDKIFGKSNGLNKKEDKDANKKDED
jgi:hypothetical protein